MRSLGLSLLLCLSAFGQSINLDTQVKGSRLPFFGTDSGSANAYVVTTIAALGPSLRTGSCFIFFAGNANTTASTLNVDSSGVKAIKKSVSTALASGDILASGLVEVCYDGTNYQLVSNGALSSGGGSGTVTSIATTSPVSGGTITTTGTISCPTCAIGPGSSTTNHLAKFSGTDGLTLADGGAIPTGTVTSVATTSPITGGTITGTGTLACATCVTSAASLTSGQLMTGAGSQASQVGDLSGDVTTSGTAATTVVKVNGVSYGTSPSTNTVPVVTGTNATTYQTVPNAALANSATTVNGTTCTLGSTCTVTAGGIGGGAAATSFQCANTSPATVLNKLARFSATNCMLVSHTDAATIAFAGLVMAGAGSTGASTVVVQGQGSCVFDGSTTAGDTVVWSTTVDGDCHDTGGRSMQNYASNYNIGTSVATNAGVGTYLVDIHPNGLNDPSGNARDFIFTLPFASSFPVASSFYEDSVNSTSQNTHLCCGIKLYWDESGGSGSFNIQNAGNVTNGGGRLNCDPAGAGYACNIWGGTALKYGNNGSLSGSVTIDWSGNTINRITASGGNVTIANPAHVNPGQFMILNLCEDGTGAHAWSWGTSYINPPSPSTAANSCTTPASPITFTFFAVDSTHIFTIASF